MSSTQKKVYVQPGQRVRIVGNYSEVCMHMGIAGKPCEIELIRREHGSGPGQFHHVAQIWKDGQPFFSSVTTGEAGFYHDEGGFYTYEDLGPGDQNPKQEAAATIAMLNAALSGPGVSVVRDLGLG